VLSLSEIEGRPMGPNFATLVGHGEVRSAVMGWDARRPTPEELDEMRRMVAEAMEEGAFGLSTGLVYPPGCYAETAELVELAKVAARYGGIYATHLRSEGEGLLQAVEEALSIGRQSGAPVQISHLKAWGRKSWGSVREALRMI
ncbi:MAG: N-acyl-D-amino-acid deacylase family protein, partial [Armatimonadota bacterium]